MVRVLSIGQVSMTYYNLYVTSNINHFVTYNQWYRLRSQNSQMTMLMRLDHNDDENGDGYDCIMSPKTFSMISTLKGVGMMMI